MGKASVYSTLMQISDLQHFSVERAAPKLGELLCRDIEEFAEEFRETSELLRRTRAGELSPGIMGTYLRSLHYLIQNTMVHLLLAEARAKDLGQTELAAYFARRRAEELGHDRWAEADMERLSERFGVTVPSDPSPAMIALVEANRKTVCEEPCFYLGYMLFAEYITVILGPEWLSALGDKCGIPKSFVTVVDNHVELDKQHAKVGSGAIDEFFDVRSSDAMREVLRGMMRRFAAFCDELCD